MKFKTYTREEFERESTTMSKAQLIKEIMTRRRRLLWYKQISPPILGMGGLVELATDAGYYSMQTKANLVETCWNLQKKLESERERSLETKSKKQLVEKIKSRLYKNSYYSELEVDLIPARFHSREEGKSLISEEALLNATKHELIAIAKHLNYKLNEGCKTQVPTKSTVANQRVQNAKHAWTQAAIAWDNEWQQSAARRAELITQLRDAVRAQHEDSVEQFTWQRETYGRTTFEIMAKYRQRVNDRRKRDLDDLSRAIGGPNAMQIYQELFNTQLTTIRIELGIISIFTQLAKDTENVEALVNYFIVEFGLDKLEIVIEFIKSQTQKNIASRRTFNTETGEEIIEQVGPTEIETYMLEHGLTQELEISGNLAIIHNTSEYRSQPVDRDFICPISTVDLMTDPVRTTIKEAGDGGVYQRKNIIDWFGKKLTDPLSNQVCRNNTLTPDIQLQGKIIDFLHKCVAEIEATNQKEPAPAILSAYTPNNSRYRANSQIVVRTDDNGAQPNPPPNPKGKGRRQSIM